METIDFFIVFASTFFNVFLLGFNSKNVHQSRYFLAFATSWGITLAQYLFAKYAVTQGGFEFILTAGIGGGLGIVAAIAVHDHVTPKIDAWRSSKKRCKTELRIVDDWVVRDQSRGPNKKRRATDR